MNLDYLDLGRILLGWDSRDLLILVLPDTTEQTAALVLGSRLTLEQPVTEVDFRSGLFWGRLVDLSPAIGG